MTISFNVWAKEMVDVGGTSVNSVKSGAGVPLLPALWLEQSAAGNELGSAYTH